MRIAMWSGPRNVSTAMMYAFAAKGDFAVWDEPFYAAYLVQTGIDHPMRDEIILSHEPDPAMVAAMCKGTIWDGKPNLYMKHMPQHMLAEFPLDWAQSCVNVHLIRHPARVIASYAAKRESVTPDDLGYIRHLQIFEMFPGPVIDSADVQAAPEQTLRRLCSEIGLEFDPAMLSWDKGPKPYDGVWASHWYGAVHESEGLRPMPVGPMPETPDHLREVLAEVMPAYEEMAARIVR